MDARPAGAPVGGRDPGTGQGEDGPGLRSAPGTPPTPPSGTPALTAESQDLVALIGHGDFLSYAGLADRLAAIEAAAVARHVRDTGCEGLREALMRAETVLENIAEWAGDAWDADEAKDVPLGMSTIHCEAVDAVAKARAALEAE